MVSVWSVYIYMEVRLHMHSKCTHYVILKKLPVRQLQSSGGTRPAGKCALLESNLMISITKFSTAQTIPYVYVIVLHIWYLEMSPLYLTFRPLGKSAWRCQTVTFFLTLGLHWHCPHWIILFTGFEGSVVHMVLIVMWFIVIGVKMYSLKEKRKNIK